MAIVLQPQLQPQPQLQLQLQPQPQPQLQSLHDLNPKLLVSPTGIRDWSIGLFSCGIECGNCICVTCCWPCTLVSMAGKLRECCCIGFCAGGAMRTKIRTMGGIKGSICNDCLVMWLCGPCATCQMLREMDEMEI